MLFNPSAYSSSLTILVRIILENYVRYLILSQPIWVSSGIISCELLSSGRLSIEPMISKPLVIYGVFWNEVFSNYMIGAFYAGQD